MFKAAPVDPITRTTDPIVVGGTVLGIKYADGVMIMTDTLASYGTQARFMNYRRIIEANDQTLVGGGGDMSDFAHIKDALEDLAISDFCKDDGYKLAPKEVYSYLSRVLYNRRSKVDPLYNWLVVGGVKDKQSFLGYVDLYGSAFEDDFIATGYGAYLAMPIIRKRWRADLTYEQAKSLLEECITICYYRDTRAINRYTLATSTQEGNKISEPYELNTQWSYSLFVNPQGSAQKLTVIPSSKA